MGKKANLAQVFKENEEKRNPPKLEVVEAPSTPKKKIAPSREDKVHVGGYFAKVVYRQLKHIGVERGMTTQDMLTEMFNDYFERNGKPPIA